MVAGPGTEMVGPGDGKPALMSGTPGAAGAASAAGTRTLVLAASVLGLLMAGWVRAGSFFPESGVWFEPGEAGLVAAAPGGRQLMRGLITAWLRAEPMTQLLLELLPEPVGRVGADPELRGLPNDKVGSDGQGVAVDAGRRRVLCCLSVGLRMKSWSCYH